MYSLALMFAAVSAMFQLPEGLLSAQCYVESKHNISAQNLKDKGGPSYGICSIKLSTARDVGFKGTIKQLREPFINIYYSGKYLNKKLIKYKNVKKAIIAYNNGHYDPKVVKYYNKVIVAYREGR